MWEYGFARLSPVSVEGGQHVWCGENQSSTACHPSACLAERTRRSTQPAPAMVMIAASVAIAVVSDPVEARPLFVTPAACFLACSASASWLRHPSWLGRPSSGLPAASWLPPRPSSGLRLRPAWRRRAPCRTPACRRAWIIVGLGFLVCLVGSSLALFASSSLDCASVSFAFAFLRFSSAFCRR